jgi:hypothetical protein
MSGWREKCSQPDKSPDLYLVPCSCADILEQLFFPSFPIASSGRAGTLLIVHKVWFLSFRAFSGQLRRSQQIVSRNSVFAFSIQKQPASDDLIRFYAGKWLCDQNLYPI